MEIQIDITKDFDKDLKKLTAIENKTTTIKINSLIDLIRSGQRTRNLLNSLNKLPKIKMNDFDSSLYIYKINKTLRVILTLEDDPLFNQKILTLLRIINHSKLELTFKGLQESIYQSIINKGEKKNG